MVNPMLELNPLIHRRSLAEKFRADGRVQIPDVLTWQSAEQVRALLLQGTPWQIAWQGGTEMGPQTISNEVLTGPGAPEAANRASLASDEAARRGVFATYL